MALPFRGRSSKIEENEIEQNYKDFTAEDEEKNINITDFLNFNNYVSEVKKNRN